jgi:putative oxidoreductase
MKQIINRMYNPINTKLGLLVLRLTLGGVFLFHGISKLQNMDGTIAFFGTLGFGMISAWIVALIETIGGVMVILGIGTRIIASLFAIILLVIIIVVKAGKGFAPVELEVVLLGMALGVGLIGCGKWSMCKMNHNGTCSADTDHCGCDCPKEAK